MSPVRMLTCSDSFELRLCLSAGFMAPLHHSEGRRQVKLNPALDNSPNVQSHDLDEDVCNPGTVYKLPVSPDNMTTVTDAFSASISKCFCKQECFPLLRSVVSQTKMSYFLSTPSEYLEDNGKTYLRVVALHEMGNLQFYNENRRLVFGGTCSLFHINTAKVETLQELYHIPQI